MPLGNSQYVLKSQIYERRRFNKQRRRILLCGGANQKGFAKMMVKSSTQAEVEKKMKEEFNATPRVMPFDQRPFQSKDSYTGEEGAENVVIFARAY